MLPHPYVENDLKLVDVKTGWYDVGIVGGQNKIVPSITLKLQNVSDESISRVQVLGRVPPRQRRQDVGRALRARHRRRWPRRGQDRRRAGAAIDARLHRARSRGRRLLQNREFVDAKVNVFGKHGSRTWIKMGEFTVDRHLLAPVE